MKITMKTPMEGPGVSRLRGDEIDVEDDEGGRLIDAGYADAGWMSEAAPTPPAAPIVQMHPNDVAPIAPVPVKAPAAKKPAAAKPAAAD